MKEHQPDQFITYKGYELMARNINWSKNLDYAWQCNWAGNPHYAESAEGVFEKVIGLIDRHREANPPIEKVIEQEWPANMPLEEQVDKLAKFILENYPKEIKGGAIETAIHIMSTQKGD